MSENLLRRLKEQHHCTNVLDGYLMREAAEEITRLRADNEKLREALAAERERCANIAEQARDDTCDGPVAWSMADSIAAAIMESGDE